MTKQTTKRTLQVLLLLGTIVSLFFVPWILVKAWILPLPETVDEEVYQTSNLGFTGVIVYIDEEGKVPQLYSAGWHNRERYIPAFPKALFKIASISKLYTAVAVTKLVKAEHLSLDKTLAEYLPGFVGRIEHADKITIRMLVQHRSGIPDYTSTHNYWVSPKETNKENLALVLDLPASFAPDTDYEYSNTNYLLLSDIMDKVLGYPHFQFIREEILQPLDLSNTFGSLSEVKDMEFVMSGYHVGYPDDVKNDNVSMLATAEDVGIFVRALNDGSLFKEGEQEIYSSLYKYEHTGLVPGYQSIAKYHQDIEAVIVLFTGPTNFDGYNWNLSDILYSRIVDIVKRQKDIE
jgi:CubicO group peptidase (beta-lactamase class C family)